MTTSVSSTLSAASLALALGVAVPAQDAAAPAAPGPFAFPADRALTDTSPDGTLWAAGALWKASFDAGGATFTPCLGRDVPSRPVHFTLAAAAIAGTALELADAVPALHGQRVQFERGAVREVYDLRPDGIEQQFVLASLASRGELRLTVAVATDLAAEADAGGFTFRCPAGGVRYGQAVAIDGAGRRLAVGTQWTGSSLQIVVPAAFVAEAVLPLVIDPLIGSVTALTPQTVEVVTTDMAFDRSLGQYYVTYERSYSATDHDVYVAYLDASMQPQGVLTIDYTAQYWSKPRIAVLEAHDVACVVAETSTANASPFAIGARRFTGGASPVLQPAQVVAANAYDRRDPDIGGDMSPVGPSRFLLAWESEVAAVNNTDIYFRLLDHNGANAGGTTLSTAIGLHRRVKVSKHCGSPGGSTEGWALVFREEYWQQTVGKLRVAFVDRNGSQRWVNGYPQTDLTVATENAGSEWDVSPPTDEAAGRKFLCTETRVSNGRGAVFAIVFDRNGFAPIGVQILAAGPRDHRAPVVDTDGIRFAVAYHTVFSAYDSDIQIHTLRYDHYFLYEDDAIYATNSFDREWSPAICASGLNDYGVAWVHLAGSYHTVECQRYHGIAGNGFLYRNLGCGHLGITATGEPSLGGTVTVSLTNAPALCGFVAGWQTTRSIPGCPTCTQGADGSTMLGNSMQLHVPVDAGLVGTPFGIQGFAFGVPNAPCLGQIELSDALTIRIE